MVNRTHHAAAVVEEKDVKVCDGGVYSDPGRGEGGGGFGVVRAPPCGHPPPLDAPRPQVAACEGRQERGVDPGVAQREERRQVERDHHHGDLCVG